MNRETIGTVAIAACCLVAISSAATTLDASVDTEPDDVVDVDSLSLPIGTDTAQELNEDIEGREADDERNERNSGTDESAESAGSGGGGQTEAGGAGGSDWTKGYGDAGSSDGLWELLRVLLDALLSLAPFLAALAAIAAAAAYRDRLRAAIEALLDDDRRDRTGEETARTLAPSNDVERAWFEMLQLFGLDDDKSKTPREYATDAVVEGANPDAVSRLTSNFEAVRYGDEPATDRRARRARRDLERAHSREGEST